MDEGRRLGRRKVDADAEADGTGVDEGARVARVVLLAVDVDDDVRGRLHPVGAAAGRPRLLLVGGALPRVAAAPATLLLQERLSPITTHTQIQRMRRLRKKNLGETDRKR